jgi:hypothetical protein
MMVLLPFVKGAAPTRCIIGEARSSRYAIL